MAAINKPNWFREHFLLRLYGIIFWLFGFAIFSMFSVFGWMEFTERNYSNFKAVYFFLKNVLLFPGLVPLLIGGVFLIFFRKSRDFFLGAFVVLPAFIVLHYVVAAVAAHDDSWRYFGFQLFEIACAFAVIMKFKRKWETIADEKESSG